jgi:hypothetical protein
LERFPHPALAGIFKILLLTAVLLASCGKDKEAQDAIPHGILDEETMAAVIADFALAESAGTLNVKNVAVSKTDSAYAFNPLKDHHLRREQYDSSLLFYSSHPEQYKKIYEKVLEKLSAFEATGTSSKK